MQLVACVVSVALVAQAASIAATKIFDYDATAPLRIQEAGSSRHDGIVVDDNEYFMT